MQQPIRFLLKSTSVVAVAVMVLLGPAEAQTSDALANSTSRVALVIGNSAYRSVAPLPNPVNDAELVAERLWEAGFEVIETIDGDREKMLADLATFRSRLREGSEALFYYAGHGVQIGGRNYLLPVSVAPKSVEELIEQSIDAQLFVDIMSNSGAKLNIVLLDACRNNPFGEITAEETDTIASRAISLGASREEVSRGLEQLSESSRGGLAEMTAGDTETIISFATAPGSVAYDGEGRHSPYTQAIADNISEPGLEIVDLFRRIRGHVRETTAGEQITWTTSTLESRFYFMPEIDDLRAATTGMSIASDTLGGLPPRRVIDRTFWRSIRESDRTEAFASYIRTMPGGAFVEDAKEQLRQLGGDPDAILVSDTTLPEPERRETGALEDGVREEFEATLNAAQITIPIGVGTKPFESEQDETGWIYVESASRLGVVTESSGKPIHGGTVHWLANDNELSYTPQIGSNGGRDKFRSVALRDEGNTSPIEAQLDVYVDACDILAGNPYDSQRVTAGTRQFIIDRNFDAAIEVCEIAVANYPDVERFWAQLARAYRSAGEYDKAIEWQQKAVDAGYASAMVYLGQMHLDAQAVPRDFARAKELFEEAADRGETAAYTALAWIYRAGVGVPQDYAQALEFYREGADLGNDWAMTNIAEFYQKGFGVEKDPNEAVNWYTAAAKSGELTAQTRLARMYQRGDEIPQDFGEARFWFETAAGRGVPNALTRLGIMYEAGQGVDQDIEAAVRLFTRAARESDSEAFYRLGRVYASRHPLFDDPGRAATLFERAVSEEVYGAGRGLGKLLFEGRGVPKDVSRARDLFALEAEKNPWAARDAGRAWASSEGAEPNFEEAARWFRVAAEGGVPWAALDLARMSEAGRGVPKDRLAALVWYATALGLSDDAKLAETVGKSTSSYSQKERVAAAQTILLRLGVLSGTADGQYGPATRRALNDAFSSRGLSAPGDDITLDVLSTLTQMN
ncbi:caspase family protein [uncultured Roseibium sp.]|uniref:caspase family protein n=1 Tax=uncultured Roseibium sp. TaxID=1936171 RepID=UPI002637AD03|nr:caspase family protein [uncultured Roseibium sp.]